MLSNALGKPSQVLIGRCRQVLADRVCSLCALQVHKVADQRSAGRQYTFYLLEELTIVFLYMPTSDKLINVLAVYVVGAAWGWITQCVIEIIWNLECILYTTDMSQF